MEDRNKDLPLIVSEILIEMHEMKEGMREMNGEMREVKNALHQMASLMLTQQQQTNNQFRALMEENRQNTTMLIDAFRDEAQEIRRRLENHEGRITKLENE